MNYKCSSFCSFFKGEKFIEKYLENILDQSIFNEVEFIFLDCDSPEKEKEYILPLTKKFKNIKYFKLDEDPGLYGGWNIAIRKCSSELITNWNVDDRKSPIGLEILCKAFDRDSELDITYGYTYISQRANETYIENSYDQVYPCLPHSLINLIKNNSPHCMPMWKKNIHEKIGFFDESYKTAADGDLWLKAAANGLKIKMINHPIGLYYNNPNGRSTNSETLKEMVQEVQRMRQKYIKYL